MNYNNLTSSATENERNNFVPGRGEFYDTSTFIFILIGAIIIINLLFIFIKILNKKLK